MSNRNKVELIRSLKLGDIVMTGNHIGAIRYLGPLDGPSNNKRIIQNIYQLYVGIELTEPNGHMNGTMHLHGKRVNYFKTNYGNRMKKKQKQHEQESKTNDNEDIDINNNNNNPSSPSIPTGEYGILIPAVSIQRKIDPFTLLKKVTLVFEQYKTVKKELSKCQSLQRNESENASNLLNNRSFNSKSNKSTNNDIRTNSDLISTNNQSPTTYGVQHRNNMINNNPKSMIRSETNSTFNSQFINMSNNNHNNSNGNQLPISQPSMNNNYSTLTMPDNTNNNNSNLNERKFKKWSTSPTLSMNKLRENHMQQKNSSNNMDYMQTNNSHRINSRYSANNNHNTSTQIIHGKGPNTYFHGSNHHNLYNRINGNRNNHRQTYDSSYNDNRHNHNGRPQTQPNPQSHRQQTHHGGNHQDNELLPDDLHIPLRKINSAPYPHRSEFIFGDESLHDSPHDSSPNGHIGPLWNPTHRQTHTFHHQFPPPNDNGTNRLFVPNSAVTTPHITNDDDINNSDFPSIATASPQQSSNQPIPSNIITTPKEKNQRSPSHPPILDKFAKSIPLDLAGNHNKITPKNVTIVTSITPQPDEFNNGNRQQLITSLPSPVRKKRHRGYTFHYDTFQNMNNQYAYDHDNNAQIDQSQKMPRSRSRPTIRSRPLSSTNNRERPSHSQSTQGRDGHDDDHGRSNNHRNDPRNNRRNNPHGIATRSRGYSYQSYTSRKATTRTPSPKIQYIPSPNMGSKPLGMGIRGSVNKLKVSLAAPSTHASPLSGPVSPATVIVNTQMDVNRELSADTTMESTSQTPNEPTPPIQDAKSIKKPNSKDTVLSIDRISNKMNSNRNRDRDKPPEIMVSEQPHDQPRITIEKSNETIDLPPPKGVLSPENSAKSDNTVNTLTTNRNRAVSGHHPSSSMFTHAPLTCWSDSNRKKTQETSAGGSADKDNDLSSLAIKVSSPRSMHITSASANLSRASVHHNKMQIFGFRSAKMQHQKQDSEQLRELLAEFRKGSQKSKDKNKQMIDNFLNKSPTTNEDVDINELDILKEDIDENGNGDTNLNNQRDNNNLSTVNHEAIDSSMEILSDTPSVTAENVNNPINDVVGESRRDSLPKLIDNNTTTATVHSPPADVIENLVTHRMISSPEEKLAEVENNDDEKCEIIPVESKVLSKLREKSPVSPTELMSDIATPVPKEAVSPSGNFDVVENKNTPNSAHTQTPKSLKSTEHTPTPKKSMIASPTHTQPSPKPANITPSSSNLPTTSLTESTLRKHNKRRASREQLQFTPPPNRRPLTSSQSNNIGTSLSSSASSTNIHFGQNASSYMNMNIDSGIKKFGGRFHHHQTTLSEPMLPKFALMMIDHLTSEDEKSGSSDGEDRQSLGMDNHLDVDDHTMDITDDDPQLVSAKSRASNDLMDAPNSIPEIPLVTPQRSTNSNGSTKSTKLFSPTFTADSISRRSSIQLTSGVFDYITPKDGSGMDSINEQLMNLSNSNGNTTKFSDINDKTDNMSTTVNYNGSTTTTYSPYQSSNSAVVGPLSYQPATPKQHYMRRMAGPGNTSSTPTYSSYKTRHEYLRDMSYFTTLHRAQEQFKKSKRGDNKKTAKDNNKDSNNKQKPSDPDEDDAKHVSFRSKGDVNEAIDQKRGDGLVIINDNSNEELEEKADSPSQKKPMQQRTNSLTSLDIITEGYDFKKDAFVVTPHTDSDNGEAIEDDKTEHNKPLQISVDKENDEEEDLDVAHDKEVPSLSSAINENSNHLTRHRTQLSCDTRAAIQGGIEPYQPPQKKEETEETDVVVVDYPSHNHTAQSAMV